MTLKPLIVGECNPYWNPQEKDPSRFAMYPLPANSAGDRLCGKIMSLQRTEYLRRFDRVNLCDEKWSLVRARARVGEIFPAPRIYILCGARVAQAFGFDYDSRPRVVDEMIQSPGKEQYAIHLVLIPHPSGRNLFWSEPGAYFEIRELLWRSGVL